MNFEEIKNESKEVNQKKNRIIMVTLFVMFIAPVFFAYTAYFNGWFSGASKNFGELLTESDVVDIEDYQFIRSEDNKVITGKEFETLYWWIMPIDLGSCDIQCLELNIYMLNQTYIGLGKEGKRLKPLLVLSNKIEKDLQQFPIAFSQFSNIGVKALEKTRSGLNKDLKANYIYLVDPLGNIFMRYPLAKDEKTAPTLSKGLRSDLLRLLKFSRLG